MATLSPTETYKAAVFEGQGAALEIKNLPFRQPAENQVLVKVLACGICHSDINIQNGQMGSPFPIVPGHEVVGDVVAVGSRITRFKGGERVGAAWHGGHDYTCVSCLNGFPQTCENGVSTGVTVDGGYAEYVLVREEAVVRVPASADPALVAPHLCAGVTVFNGIRKLHIEQGALVAVQGLGGLGHLAVQFAHKMGYKVVAISSGSDKAQFAEQLGAYAYIDTSKDDAAKILQSMGGASLIVSTAPNAQAISPLVWGLTYGGKLLLLAPIGPVAVDSVALVMKAASVHGWPGGNALDCEETIAFAEHHGVQCMVEHFPLNEAVKAFNHMVQGKPKFRAVLTM